jgi:hypothetical protein
LIQQKFRIERYVETFKDMTSSNITSTRCRSSTDAHLQKAGKLLYFNSSPFAHLVPTFFILVGKPVSSFDGDITEAVDSRPLWRKILFSFAALIKVSAVIIAALGVGLGEDGVPDKIVAWIAFLANFLDF